MECLVSIASLGLFHDLPDAHADLVEGAVRIHHPRKGFVL
jgi:hypothetical protein